MKPFHPFINFTAKCFAVCGSVIFLLFLLNLRYEQVMDRPYSDADKFRYMNSTYNNIQICNIGSSHGEYAFYYEDLSKKSGYQCFNFAMASQTYDYDYAVLSMYRNHFAKDCIMFIPVSYFSFNNEVINETEEEFLRAKYYTFLSPRYIPHYDPYIDIVTHYFPILSAGEDISKLLPSFSLRALAAEAAPADNHDGPSEEEFLQKALDRYSRHMDDKEEYFMAERIDNLYAILSFCEDHGITPVLITTPYTSYYYEQASVEFKEQFRSLISSIASDCGVSYYDYSEDERFSNHLEYFSDADHLNDDGAALFMDIIKQEIPEFADFLSRNQFQSD